jgi:hypothetical protein
MPDLGAFPWGTAGPAALLAFAVVLILTGRITTRQALEDARADRDKFEQAWNRSQDTVGELAQQVTALVEIGRTTQTLLESLVNERDDREPAA